MNDMRKGSSVRMASHVLRHRGGPHAIHAVPVGSGGQVGGSTQHAPAGPIPFGPMPIPMPIGSIPISQGASARRSRAQDAPAGQVSSAVPHGAGFAHAPGTDAGTPRCFRRQSDQ